MSGLCSCFCARPCELGFNEGPGTACPLGPGWPWPSPKSGPRGWGVVTSSYKHHQRRATFRGGPWVARSQRAVLGSAFYSWSSRGPGNGRMSQPLLVRSRVGPHLAPPVQVRPDDRASSVRTWVPRGQRSRPHSRSQYEAQAVTCKPG